MEKIYSGHSKSPGVYQILNKVNGKRYFGQASRLANRAMGHESALNSKKHSNKHLQAAWDFYGSDAFQFTVLHVVEDKTERDAVEQKLIDEWYGEQCYNIAKEVTPCQTTWSHTPEETSRKKSEAKKGIPRSEETKQKLREANLGKKPSEETRRKLSEAMKGRVRSSEHRANLSAAVKGNTNSLGRIVSSETRRKISESQKGKIVSEETRRKIAEAGKGRPSTRKGKKGPKASEETKKKMSEAQLARHPKKIESTQLFLDEKTETSDSE